MLEYLFPGNTVEELLKPPNLRELQSTIDKGELDMTARDAAEYAEEHASRVLPDISLDQLESDVHGLAVKYQAMPPADVFREGRHLLELAQGKLKRTQRPRQQERLYHAAGCTAALLSAVAFDLASTANSATFARTAVIYGENIEHGPLQAYAYGVLAYLANWAGEPREAIRHIQKAKALAGLGATATTRLAVIEGRAHAHLGDQRTVEAAIRTARDTNSTDRDDIHDDIGGEFAFPHARVAMSNATSYLLAGNATGGEQAAQQALLLLAEMPIAERSPLTLAQAQVDLARALILRGELDGAAETLIPALDLPQDRMAAGLLERLAEARRELSRPGLADARQAVELAERIADSVTLPAPRTYGGLVALEP
ncbi:hypothetical protein OG705_29415 [Streptomyces sp. NBC_00838]|uniref:hypothetical protein n=1 Tax=Streptomyces sp. NBC_00838 TaxID=2903680 RepID=UPI00386D8A4D|nr:hypothetical protein OG705_29415 [Streptomyces sp. NBC_00838]